MEENTVKERIASIWASHSNQTRPKIKQTNPFPDNKFHLFWYDIHLERLHNKFEMYLIGIAYYREEFYQACVKINTCREKFYLLPAKDATLSEVMEDFNQTLARQFNLEEYDYKPVVKRYAFDPNIEFEGRYVEITTANVCNVRDVRTDKIERILGRKSSSIEEFLMSKHIKGPCWLEFDKIEGSEGWRTCPSVDQVSVGCCQGYIPALSVAVINVKSVYVPERKSEVIVLIGVLFQRNFDVNDQRIGIDDHLCFANEEYRFFPDGFCVKDCTSAVVRRPTEKLMVQDFLLWLGRLDADIVMAYDLDRDMRILQNRMQRYGLKYIPRSLTHHLNTAKTFHNANNLFSGRLRVSLLRLSTEMVKSRTYTLEELTKDHLDLPFVPVDQILIENSFENASKLTEMIDFTMHETLCSLKLSVKLNLLPFSLEMTRVCGSQWNLTLNGTVSDRCEYLLSHAFYEENFILPDKIFGRGDAVKRRIEGGGIEGGLVLEPRPKLYGEFVVALDFNALYPSVIREYNLCFSTLLMDEDGTRNVFEGRRDELGVIPKLMTKLLSLRAQMKRTGRAVQADVLKRTTNSIYGYLAYPNSRFYSRHTAAEITRIGRQILTNTIKTTPHDVIYGDTDSIMFTVTTPTYPDALQIANDIIKQVNANYQHVNIGLSSIFRSFVIFSKKKYAGIELYEEMTESLVEIKIKKIKERLVFKGVEVVRRDFSGVARKAAEFVLTEMLRRPEEVHFEAIYQGLKKFTSDALSGDHFDVDDFVISQRLTEDIRSYKDKARPHINVVVSEFCVDRKRFNKNDVVSYVYCSDDDQKKLYEKARHVDEVKSKRLAIDYDYYVDNQVFPVVKRILTVVDGFDERRLREALSVSLKRKVRPLERAKPSDELVKKCHLDKENLNTKPKHRPNKAQNAGETIIDSYTITCPECSTEFRCSSGLDFLYKCPNECWEKCEKNAGDYFKRILASLVVKYLFSPQFCTNLACGFQVETTEVDEAFRGDELCPRCETNEVKCRWEFGEFETILWRMLDALSARSEQYETFIDAVYVVLENYGGIFVDLGAVYERLMP